MIDRETVTEHDTRGTSADFARAARQLAEAKGVAPTLDAVVTNAVTLLGCEWAIVAATDQLGSRPARLSASTDEAVAQTVAAAASEAGDSPGIAAFTRGEVVRIDDILSDRQFPRYVEKLAERTAIRSVLSIPLRMHDTALGVLSCYSTRPGAFDDAAIADGQTLAVHAVVAIEAARDEVRAENLEIALLNARTIGAAIGILVERRKITPDDAWALLRKSSQDLNRPLASLAAEVVETGYFDDQAPSTPT